MPTLPRPPHPARLARGAALAAAFGLGLVLAPAVAGADKSFLRGKGATWDCAQDPVVNILHGKGAYTLTGACTTVNVNGGKLTITADRVGTLNVNGGDNTITLGALGTANLNGSNNAVTYRGPAATIHDLGKGNTVTHQP